MNILCVIPARGGSKRFPGKNLAKIAGRSLLAITIQHAKESQSVSKVIVSTDCDEIAKEAIDNGAGVVMRPVEISGSEAKSEEALLHVLDYIEKNWPPHVLGQPRLDPEGPSRFDLLVMLQCTSPIRRHGDVENAIQTFLREEADSLFSACPNTRMVWVEKEGTLSPSNHNPLGRPRTQDMREWAENGSIYIMRPSLLQECGARLDGMIVVYPQDEKCSVDIDTPEDLALAEWYLSPIQRPQSAWEILGPDEYWVSRKGKDVGDYWAPREDPDGVIRDRLTEGGRQRYLRSIQFELEWIRSLAPERVLDVGCGPGWLMESLMPDCYPLGVEPNENVRPAWADERFEDLGGSRADVAILHHVLEHVENPLQLLHETLEHLRPGGLLLVGTPDFDGVAARQQGQAFRLLHDPTHISLFSEDSMRRMLRDAGIKILHLHRPYWGTPWEGERLDVTKAFPGNFLSFFCEKVK